MSPEQPSNQPEAAPPTPTPTPAPSEVSLPPQKKKLSTGVIIAIIAGSVFLLFTITLLILALIFVPRMMNSMSADMTNDTSSLSAEKGDSTSVTHYESESFRFAYSDSWKQKDTSNQTTIIGGVEPDGHVVIRSGDEDSSVILNYTYNKGSAEPVDKQKARSAMNTALQAQKNATQSQLIAMREATGHGCAENVAYTTAPTLQEKGDLIGYTYGFTCDSFYGPVQGEYGVWYDEYGAQHRLLVSSLEPYWEGHASELRAIMESAEAR